MSATIDVIAARANVHRASVSRILNGKGGAYSALTRERVLQAARELDYQPNLLARALVTGTSKAVSLWMVAQQFYSPYFGFVYHTLYQEGVKRGYQLLTEQFYDVLGGHDAGGQTSRWPVDGILAYDLPKFAAEYRRAGPRSRGVVTLGEWCDPEADHVRVDLVPPTIEAVRHLLSGGDRSIAFVTPLMDTNRGRAYAASMGEAGLEPEPILVDAASRSGGYDAMRERLRRARGVPGALLCFNDEVALGCYAALTEAGLRVPDDVRIVGCDGLDDVRYLPCPMTCIHIPVAQMCSLAWDTLLERLAAPDMPVRQHTLTPRLQIRASSTPPTD
jgi:DNA-binding LacI/PurR family transcriptional regulator